MQKTEPILPKVNSSESKYISFTINGVTHEVVYIYSEKESYLILDSQLEYDCTDAYSCRKEVILLYPI